ncbi:MAG: type II toxin-antitoxin system VapC family toxin [Leptolinea sp.]|jgi:predicted nucleic acid-binding protein|nr:type II toxin-antitoxin system VapC family toxin [Leptolinea sp.]
MNSTPAAVLDAYIPVSMVVNSPLSQAASNLWKDLTLSGTQIVVPCLWIYEVTSLLRQLVSRRVISARVGESSLSLLLESNIHFREEDATLALNALRWADRLGYAQAGGCFYVALADQLGAEFWSADRRLAGKLKAAGWPHIRELEK